ANVPAQEYISFDASSFIVQNSVFPTYPFATSGPEMLHGVNGIPVGGYGIFRDNYFGHTYGFSDTIDFTGGNRPGAILQVIGNIFDGAGDDHLDLDSTDAWIEGNIFMHAHRDPNRTDDARDTASAISGGVDVATQYSEWTIINNLFYDVDHACLNKQGGRFIFANNTLVHVAKESGGGLIGDIAAFDFTDDGLALPDPSIGAGAFVANNIIWDVPQLVANYNAANHTVIFDNNILPQAWAGPGTNNIVTDPLLNLSLITNVATADWRTVKAAFQPKANSPAIGTGIGGSDRGGLNPKGLLVYGEPSGTTPSTTATVKLFPGGVFNWGSAVPPYTWGYTGYRWKLDGGTWSAEISITNKPTLTLSNLSNGPHTLYVSGKNDAGYFQDDAFVYPLGGAVPAHATASHTWIVNTNESAIRINEVLAANDSAVPVGSKFPDLIEFYNSGTTSVDLGGMTLSGDLSNPGQYMFPLGTLVGAGQYLIAYADSDASPAGIHTGFGLKKTGDALYLFSKTGRLVDSVEFGLQLSDLSVGRLADGSWGLTDPTFGAANKAHPLGNPATLKINEWLAASVSDPDFIELYNPASLPVSLGGFFLSDRPIGAPAKDEIAPLSFIPGNGFAVFYADGHPKDGADHLNFQLSKEQGMIGLSDPELNLIDMVVYGPQKSDISQGRSPNGSNTIIFFSSPTPGAPNPLQQIAGAGRLVVNEIMANNATIAEGDGTISDWLELYNGTTNAIDLGDMSLSDSTLVPRRYIFPLGTVVPALGYYALRCDSGSPVSSTNTGFGLNKTGGSIFLFDKLASAGSLLDGLTYGLQAVDFSIGRVPDGSTNWVLNLPTRKAANLAAVPGQVSQLKINEWMAAPASGSDWFEIFNPSAQPVALGGLYLTDDLSTPTSRKKYQIPALSFIGTGLYGFQEFFADTPVGGDHTNFKLSNSGEALGISYPDGSVIDSITFGPQQTGVSQGRLPDGSANIVSFPASPTPADSNFLPMPDVVINEVLTHTDLPFEDAIELRNLSGNAVNIGGWYLSDAKHTLKKFRIPDGTTLPANGFLVFYEYQFNPNPGFLTSFSLNSAKGDDVYLSAALANGALTGLRAQVSFGAAQNAVSFGRYTTSVGVDFVAMAQRTFGTDNPDTVQQFRTGTGLPNSLPKVGPIVISEIMYHPASVDTNDNVLDEFIELHNITLFSAPLYDASYPSNVWRLKKAVSFSFPTNSSLAPNGYGLVVGFDPALSPATLAAFRSKYAVPAGVPVFGPYEGKLANDSDSVELYKPDAPQTIAGPDLGFVPYILVDRIQYADSAPWPAAPDGTGPSLQRVNDALYGNDPVNWTSGNPTAGRSMTQDSDGDGLPDDWEIAHSLDPNSAVGVNGANGDPDSDGQTNLQEYFAGTDPRSATSVLRLTIVNQAGIKLRFTAEAGHSYTIEFTGALGTGWSKLLDIDASGSQTTWEIPDSPVGVRFYRVRTPKAP
ncbi:MAG TPA: lamin tail domain-containing protein, partial [Candidatus Saccharimonadales bacterium]|nr:lamin tail domain-containing protein [Candidatus Saccharimonadales bacterium]